MTMHPDTGTLRRLIDEPQEAGAQVRSHVQTCEECAREVESLKRDAASVRAALAVETRPDTQRALTRVGVRAAQRHDRRFAFERFAGLAAAAALVVGLLFTPLGSYARSFLTIFEPQQFQPVQLSPSEVHDLRLVPQARQFGTQRIVTAAARTRYASLAQARRRLSFAPEVPRALPQGIAAKASYFVSSPGEWTFTFSAAKARAFAARSHRALPAMPAELDGTTVRVRTGAVFEARYGSSRDMLEVVQTTAPVVSSTGATLEQLEAYLVKLPGISPELVQQLSAMDNARTTLPIPFDARKQHAQKVTVQGSPGLAIGDNTGLGAGVMWRENGLLHLVAGSVSMDDALSVANGLK